MSDYSPLGGFLTDLKADYWRPTFLELERMVGFGLPQAAKRRAGWWTDTPSSGPARTWLDAGWSVRQVDLGRQRITFVRGESPAPQVSDDRIGDFVRERPVLVIGASAGVALGAGLLVGLLLGNLTETSPYERLADRVKDRVRDLYDAWT